MTRSGWCVGISGLLLLAAGWWADYPPLVVLGVACLVALAGGAAWVSIRTDLVAARQLEPSRISEDEVCRAVLTVRNAGLRRALPTVASERLGPRQIAIPIPAIRAGGTHRIEYALPATRRGRHEVGPLTVGRSDPFRLLRVDRVSCAPTTLWVHPRTYRVHALPAGRAQDMDGPTSAGAPRGGVAFYGLREYVPGDDLRNIHWRSTARTGTLMVRENVVPHRPQLVVLLDTERDSYHDDYFEEAVRIAASLCNSACDGHHPVELRTTGGALLEVGGDGGGFAGGKAAATALLDLLAVVELNERAGDRGFAGAASTRNRSASVAVVTGRPSPGRLVGLRRLRERFGFVAVIALGAVEDRFSALIPGALVVHVPTAERFAEAWNAKVAS
ncbi:MAG: DUF58 domain-containing protein [Acidimicrobiaceae bacterium]|nr:DUF58 domain-containing protein [Acidimicrobiaceae bacterium]